MGKGKRASIDSSYMVRLLFRKGYWFTGGRTVDRGLFVGGSPQSRYRKRP